MRLNLLPLLLGVLPLPAVAQGMDPAMPMDHSGMDHSGMDHSGMEHGPAAHAVHAAHGQTSASASFSDGSGTARLPGAEPAMTGLHFSPGADWMVMLHGAVSGQYSAVSGPRGDDKLYATSMAMAMAQKTTDWGRVQLNAMLSLEPAMQARGYPNLFATGETAGGVPLVDRQHPHDLFMELSARVDVDIAPQTRLFLYGGPVAEPALGPSAFMHRSSAALNPEPPIAHHWFDSTHITYGVVTAGLSAAQWQIEASAFRGQEPDERRWNIETPRLDSWSVRASWTPTPNWALQASHGFLKTPEATHAGANEHRTTASVHYTKPGFAAMLGFSAKRRDPGDTLRAWLGEASWQLTPRDTVFGRVENVTNDELFPDHAHPLHDVAFRVTKFQLGYARSIPLGPVLLALGGAVSAYAKPAVLNADYGTSPIGYTLFARISL